MSLIVAVLREGLKAHMRYVTATNRRVKRLCKEAETWIFEDDPTRPCSFVSICHVTGPEPDYVRTGL